jgi:hypothetical protein
MQNRAKGLIGLFYQWSFSVTFQMSCFNITESIHAHSMSWPFGKALTVEQVLSHYQT